MVALPRRVIVPEARCVARCRAPDPRHVLRSPRIKKPHSPYAPLQLPAFDSGRQYFRHPKHHGGGVRPECAAGVAGRNRFDEASFMTQFFRNTWYVAASAGELEAGQRPLRRIFLQQPVALYRLPDGSPVALQDRCPHRLVPLSLGKLIGDRLQCIYHGLQFDRTGACVHNPHSGSGANRIRVTSYPLTERYGYVWIWPGDPARADASLIPRLDFLDDGARFAVVRGYLKVQANYELISDNLLDLTHVEFLHPLFARHEGVGAHDVEFLQEGNSVIANRRKPNTSLNAFAKLLWTSPPERGDGRANMRWTAPSNLLFDLGVSHVGGEPEAGLCTPATHLLTPETAYSTHYFWAQGRNLRLDDRALDQQIVEVNSRVFDQEDRLVIEAQQAELGERTDILEAKPLLFNADKPAVLARRLLRRLIAAEAGSQSTVASGS